ncbi:DUF2283 domain-containing protein [Candidatus Pacearchaeota archaeon]|nr:DUF2283 domain-containing protein [Candidatus Pacearchaeota archaeon]
MKIEYDSDVDAAYIYLDESPQARAEKTIELNENIIVDFDKNGKLIGIEILSASKVLRDKSTLSTKAISA